MAMAIAIARRQAGKQEGAHHQLLLEGDPQFFFRGYSEVASTAGDGGYFFFIIYM